MGKGSETFCNTAKEGNGACEGWAGAGPCKADSTRLKSAKCGGGIEVETARQRGQQVGDYGNPGER